MDIATWTTELSATDVTTRRAAAEKLAQAGTAARGAVVPLVRAVGDDDETVCEWSAAALESLGAPDEADLVALVGLLEAASPDSAYWAATLIGRLEKRAVLAVPKLAARLGAKVPDQVRERVAWALGMIGLRHPEAEAALAAAAASDSPRLARTARQALESLRDR